MTVFFKFIFIQIYTQEFTILISYYLFSYSSIHQCWYTNSIILISLLKIFYYIISRYFKSENVNQLYTDFSTHWYYDVTKNINNWTHFNAVKYVRVNFFLNYFFENFGLEFILLFSYILALMLKLRILKSYGIVILILRNVSE